MKYKWMLKKFFLIHSLIIIGIQPIYAFPKMKALKTFPEIKHDISPPFGSHEKLSNQLNQIDAKHLPTKTKIPFQVFAGMGVGLEHYQVKTLNPSVSGAVGMTQYVQTVNYDIAIFDKKSGQIFSGFPKASQEMWKGFGGQCEQEIGKYASVRYDQLVNRWIISQTTSSHQCIAISTDEDATGSYHRYAFDLNAWIVNAKFAVWPNAYFMSFDTRDKSSYTDSLACALDKNKMLAGSNATIQCHIVPRHFYTLTHVTPVDLEGTNLPFEADMPGYFMGTYHEWFNDSVILFRFYVDFDHPNNAGISTFIHLTSKPPTMMNKAMQPNGDFLEVDDNGINFNPRVVYRVFNGAYPGGYYGSLMGCQTATTPANGLNQYWFEYQNYWFEPEKFWSEQEGSLNGGLTAGRFTGSIAMDSARDLVIGNNVSSSLIYPSIELNYRSDSDPESQLPNQQILLAGLGAQTATPVNKWGTQSALTIDPADDCTFWYTNAYLKTTGSYNWSTAIFNFKLPNCT